MPSFTPVQRIPSEVPAIISLTGKDLIRSPILIVLFQHSNMRQEGRIVKILGPIGTSMDAALTLDADARYPVRPVLIDGTHGTLAGTEAAGRAFSISVLGTAFKNFAGCPSSPLGI